MIDITSTSCRICLEQGAIYPIFESNDEFDAIYTKLAACIQQKLEDIEGYPRNICLKCKNTCDTISHFIAKFEKTHKILNDNIVQIKSEYSIGFDPDDNHFDDQGLKDFTYDSEISANHIVPKLVYKNPTELLESLSHLTIKRIKVENNSDNIEIDNNENNYTVKRKKGRPKQGENKKVAKKPPVGKTKQTTAKADVKNTARKGVVSASVKECKSEKKKESRQIYLDLLDEIKKEHDVDLTANENAPKLCDLCGITRKTADSLARHKIVAHQERKFKCTKCSNSYLANRDLQRHIKHVHEKIRTAICDHCGKASFTKSQLKNHIETVHLNRKKKPLITKCRFCDKEFRYKKGAIIHERAVHTGERPAVCDVCGSSFYDEAYLKEHMRLHTGDTPHKCPVCGRGYAQRGNMKSHMRNHKISELPADVLAKVKPSYYKFMRP